ncbi:MAG: 2-dehydro-3-deoxyphosphooctonate aldolase synthase [Candidatus Sumerlaeota bacterium]|nr:2-dehydro-3-deoxyphosphooctonate aldolase synthase [Candidatus Sumerlaeota bacterium]
MGGANPLVLIAGPCVIESREHALEMAERIARIAQRLSIPLIFKASYDKANRSSSQSYRGPGLERGLAILGEVRSSVGCPVLTDVHTEEQAAVAASVVDVLQLPAFLCRQTDFVQACGRTGKPVAVKKGQFLAPEDMTNVVEKLREVGCNDILLTERGASFGYRNLVSDFRSLAIMQALTGLPVCFDATHSVQQPGGLGTASGGKREFVPLLARAACAVGINVLFLEVHDRPEQALSDGPNMVPLTDLEALLKVCLALDAAVRSALQDGAQ